jgi:acyl carrier protein
MEGDTAVREKLRMFILENFLYGDEEVLDQNSSFIEEGIIDSTGVLELISFLEREFELKVQDEELIPENFDSLESLTSFVLRKLNGMKSD